MSRTLQQLRADVMREVRGQASVFEVAQAIQDAVNAIDALTNWEFTLTNSMILVEAPYQTGTVAIAAGSTSAALASGTWATTWKYKEIKLSSRSLPYPVSSFPTIATATLSSSLSGSTNITADTYKIYQARYALPADCEPGRDLTLKGPSHIGQNGSLPKRPRLTYEHHTSEMSTGMYPMYYTDEGYDEAAKVATIRLEPYPTRTYELRLTYFRKLTVPTLVTDTLMIPEAFERAPILMAASSLLRKKGGQGWQALRQEAGDLLQRMFNRYSCSAAYEGKINPRDNWSGDGDDFFAFDSQMYIQ